jgi:hypothetical protein
VAYLSAAVLYVIGLAIRDIYEALKRRNRVDTCSTPVFALVFTSMCVHVAQLVCRRPTSASAPHGRAGRALDPARVRTVRLVDV